LLSVDDMQDGMERLDVSSIHKDRWVEIDLNWFDRYQIHAKTEELAQSLVPLFKGVQGAKGMILNCGWLIDLITEWTGNPEQPLPIRSQLLNDWKGFTYQNLKGLFAALRAAFQANGYDGMKFGMMFVAWGYFLSSDDMYDIRSDWYERHPELYPHSSSGFKDMNPGVPLVADDYPYATRPQGLQDGDSFQLFFGEQWGDLSRYLELDAIHLRDQFSGPMIYARNGPYGPHASSNPEDLLYWTEAYIRLFREVKQANPRVILMGYSSSVSAIADWRVACVDLETMIAEGSMDIWVDQTWGGAWQEWWSEWRGWTFQLSYLIMHANLIESANRKRKVRCKHYNLIETWDAWEPWDTLHHVPEKLRWGIWAYSHASVQTEVGPRTPDGSYISWLSNRARELLSHEDINFIASNLNEAQSSAQRLEVTYGPQMIYNRRMMEWLSANHPNWNVSEWLDDHTAFLMKWGVPCLSSSRLEWLQEPIHEPLLVQVPGQLNAQDGQKLERLIDEGHHVWLVGRADVIDEGLLAHAGTQRKPKGLLSPGYHKVKPEASHPPGSVQQSYNVFVPECQPIEETNRGEIIFRTDQTPLILKSKEKPVYYWQPQDFNDPKNQSLPMTQVGSFNSYWAAAKEINQSSAAANQSYVQDVAMEQPIAVHYWKSAGTVYLLVGNLETGFVGDARLERSVSILINRSHLGLSLNDYVLHNINTGDSLAASSASNIELTFKITISSNSSSICKLISL
jgi:hypothetical protein